MAVVAVSEYCKEEPARAARGVDEFAASSHRHSAAAFLSQPGRDVPRGAALRAKPSPRAKLLVCIHFPDRDDESPGDDAWAPRRYRATRPVPKRFDDEVLDIDRDPDQMKSLPCGRLMKGSCVLGAG